MLAALPFPEFRPDLVTLPGFSLFGADFGPFPIRWYALAYLAGLLLGWLYIRRLLATPALWARSIAPARPSDADDLLVWMTFGVVIGGRLGFVLFYDPSLLWTLSSDLTINVFGWVNVSLPQAVEIWRGGMAFHGGLLGAAVATALYARRIGAPALSLGDAVAAAAPIGLFFGRIANFINGELWGRPTDAPWGMVFPQVVDLAPAYPWLLGPNGENLPRHPSQLYEAALEGLVLFAILAWLIWARRALARPGLVAGVFLAGYGAARFSVEYFRQWNVELGLDVQWGAIELSRGQLLSVPMVLVGVWLARRALDRRRAGPA